MFSIQQAETLCRSLMLLPLPMTAYAHNKAGHMDASVESTSPAPGNRRTRPSNATLRQSSRELRTSSNAPTMSDASIGRGPGPGVKLRFAIGELSEDDVSHGLLCGLARLLKHDRGTSMSDPFLSPAGRRDRTPGLELQHSANTRAHAHTQTHISA